MDHELTVEQEGRISALLRAFGHSESEEERLGIAGRLEELTGVNHGASLGRWLSWYLEEHLEMRGALGIQASNDGEVGFPSLMDELVFERPEYNWCALERIRTGEDMRKLRMLYTDLETPLAIHTEGPFGFRRLTGLDDGEVLAFFDGKSLSDALFAEAATTRHLKALKDYGKMMMIPLFPSATQRTGAIVYAAAISQALVRFDEKITSLSLKDLSESLPALLGRPYLVERFSELFKAALVKCQEGAGL
jgi:hypothetical protein